MVMVVNAAAVARRAISRQGALIQCQRAVVVYAPAGVDAIITIGDGE
jgi:hypothetical protein